MFRSFYLAGFECATGTNRHGEWIDQIEATQHDQHVDEDYARLREVDIHAVREAIRWPVVDRGGRYDFSSAIPFVEAAVRHKLDVVWDLFHYGYPAHLDPLAEPEEFARRFADYCAAAAHFVRERTHGCRDGVCAFTPVNEPSYLAWAAGEAGLFAPHARGRGPELKVALARAALLGIDAIQSVCSEARIVNVDPICRVVPRSSSAEDVEHARRFNEGAVFETWDMLCGRLLPELGGSPAKLGVVGINYYWTNQWELGSEGTPLADNDPRRVPLADLIRTVWRRYGNEVLITETSALGDKRGPWLHELSAMADQLLDEGVRLGGICLYPILGMPEWHAREEWTQMGLWELEKEQEILQRKIHTPMLDALRHAQHRRRASATTRTT